MKAVIIGAGGVGAALVSLLASRPSLEAVLVCDFDLARAREAVDRVADPRFQAAQLDASSEADVTACLTSFGADIAVNACDPRLNPPIFDGCFAAGVSYLDMAMHMSSPHPTDPHTTPGVKLGDAQFEVASQWEERGLLALVGMGVEAGISDVFARYASDHLFDTVDTFDIRDGANLAVEGYRFAPTFSVWTLIEECLNPPVIWERERGWFTTAPFSEREMFTFPEGIGPLECVNVEHEEVLLIPRWLDCNRVTFKYGLGDELIDTLQMLSDLGLASTEPVNVGGQSVSPRDLVAAVLPDPRHLGPQMSGLTCAGTWVRGTASNKPRSTYLYHVVDNAKAMSDWGHQAVVLQTALGPAIALEMLSSGAWAGSGVLGPEAFVADPFLATFDEFGMPWGQVEV